MKKGTLKNLMFVGVVLTMVGCGGGSTIPEDDVILEPGTITLPTDVQAAIDGPESNLTDAQELKDAITFMYSEEGLAYDVYMKLYETYDTVEQFINIATKSEVKHIEAVNQIAQKYDLNMTQYPDTDVPYSIEGISAGNYAVTELNSLYSRLITEGESSKPAALEVGCEVEIVDILDLERHIALVDPETQSDILAVFNFLINGSYNHYWAFNDALVKMDKPGCCQIAMDDYGYTSCPTYPKK